LRGEQDGIEALGARLVFVGNGSTEQARHFNRRYAPGSAIFTDPSAYTYRAIGARSGVASTLGGSLVHGVRAMRGGHFQTSIEGRPFQHGGVLIVLPGDAVAYAHISRMAGDHPANTEVMTALVAAVHAVAAAPAPTPEPASPKEVPDVSAPALPALTAGDAAPAAEPAPPMLPPWPGAPPGTVAPHAPRWSFQLPESSKPPRSAAG
jgi:alkyl-hydroperoxide reductase/thiol specific antioxidant family protein